MSAPPFPRRVITAFTNGRHQEPAGIEVTFTVVDRWVQGHDPAYPGQGAVERWHEHVGGEPELCHALVLWGAAYSAAVQGVVLNGQSEIGRDRVRRQAVRWIDANPGLAPHGWHAVIWFDLIGSADLRPKPVIVEVPNGIAARG